METSAIFERWLKNPVNLDHDLSDYHLQNIPAFLDSKMQEISRNAETHPDHAFAQLLEVIGFINAVIRKKPGILDRLAELISKFKDALARIASSKLADSYSISAGFPLNVSLSLSWNTDLHIESDT